MKILMVNKYYFIKGGSERYFFELSKILEKSGHEIIPFAMQHPQNFETEFSEYFVDNIEYNLNGTLNKIKKSFGIAGRMIYSTHAKSQVEQLINLVKPEIAHLHMIDHQLSPSILHVFKRHDIPVIQTVHQYKLVCPNYRLYNMYKQEVCERCINGSYYHPILEKCHKDSSAAGLLIAMEMYIHKMMKIYKKNINMFHVPSHFMGKKLNQIGIPENQIQHLFYTIEIDKYKPSHISENYIIYYGRLAKEKGILTLLKAMKEVSNTELFIVGDGPQRNELEMFASNNNLEHVKFLGLKGGEELKNLVASSSFVVVPSEWYDNSPLVIYESFSLGKAVVGANMGGIPELIDNEVNGLHFQAGDVEELAERMNFLLKNKKTCRNYGINARKKAETEFAPRPHYEKIMAIYRKMINTAKGKN